VLTRTHEDVDRLAREVGGPARQRTDARLGDPAQQLLAVADEHDAAYVVVGSRSLGPIRSLLSQSVSDAVLRQCRRPVVVVPQGASATSGALGGGSVICGVDGTSEGERTTIAALVLARALRVRLVLVHARRRRFDAAAVAGPDAPVPVGAPSEAPHDDPPDALVGAARAAGAFDGNVTAHVAFGTPHQALARAAAEENAALVVVGRSDRARWRSTTRQLLRSVAVPVVSIPAADSPTHDERGETTEAASW
jgi:nucleotide-binding universal stress UspA family protein